MKVNCYALRESHVPVALSYFPHFFYFSRRRAILILACRRQTVSDFLYLSPELRDLAQFGNTRRTGNGYIQLVFTAASREKQYRSARTSLRRLSWSCCAVDRASIPESEQNKAVSKPAESNRTVFEF